MSPTHSGGRYRTRLGYIWLSESREELVEEKKGTMSTKARKREILTKKFKEKELIEEEVRLYCLHETLEL
jgi:hypothetical protein